MSYAWQRWVPGALTLLCPVVAGAAPDPCRRPDISPSFFVADTVFAGPRPAFATAGTTHFAVICEPARLAGRSITAEGSVGPPVPIAEYCATAHGVAFDGTNFLVARGHNSRVRGVRVSPDGMVLDTDGGFSISADDRNLSGAIRVASDGARSLVTWVQQPDDIIVSAWVTPEAQVSSEIPIPSPGALEDSLASACDPTGCVVVWVESANETIIRGARLEHDGSVIDFGTIASGYGVPDVIFDGQGYFMVHVADHTLPAPGNYLVARRLSTGGLLLDEFLVDESSFYKSEPHVAFDGTHYWLTWEAVLPIVGTEIQMTAVSASGEHLFDSSNEPGVHVRSSGCDGCSLRRPSVLPSGSNLLLGWLNERSSLNPAVEAAIVHPTTGPVPGCWTLAGNTILKGSASGVIRGYDVHCRLACRFPVGGLLYLEPDDRYRIPSDGGEIECPLGGTAAIPDEIGHVHVKRRGRLVLDPENLDDLKAALAACVAVDARVHAYGTWVRPSEDGTLAGETRLRARYRAPPTYGVRLPVTVRETNHFAGVQSGSGLPLESPPLSRRQAKLPVCSSQIKPKCNVE